MISGSSETGNVVISEPIETSVISRHVEMIIVEPRELNRADNGLSIMENEEMLQRLADVRSDLADVESMVESNTDSHVTPSRKKRKR